MRRFWIHCICVFVLGAVSAHAQPVISEFMASNDETYADEDGEFEDWVEIHNPSDQALSLSGWFLTDRADNLTKWMFPAVTIPANGYLVVFTSGKDRTDPAGVLHASFSLSAGGEYLGLVQPDGTTIAYQYAPEFPPQITDISYGITTDGETNVIGYLAEATPGASNGGTQDVVLDESVVFSTGSTTFSDSITVSLSGATGDQVIRYVLSSPSEDGGDTPDPDEDSLVYNAPLTLTESTVLSATVFSSNGQSHGVISTIQLVEIDGDGGTGLSSFSTSMPVVVVDNHGAGPMIPVWLEGGAERRGWLYTFEPSAGGLTRISDGPTASTMVDFRVRGQTSSMYPKKGFKFEMRNDWGEKTPFDLLGMGPFDEWNMVSPYLWDTAYIRNAYSYEVSNAIGRWAAKTRLAEVFLNTDDDGLSMADYHGVVIMVDKTDVEPGRIDLERLDDEDNEGNAVTGGYLLLVDEPDPEKLHWRTDRGFPDIFNSELHVDTPKLDDITPEQSAYIVDYVQRMEDALYADAADNWRRRHYLEYLDRGSWIDHHMLNVFFKNTDAFWRSSYYHKDRGQRLAAGPIWDMERSMDSFDPRDGEWNTWRPTPSTSQGEAVDYWGLGWWGMLAQDPDFMQAWVDRWQSLRVGVLGEGSIRRRFDAFRGLVSTDAAARDAAKWPENASRFGDWASEMDYMETWLVSRGYWIDLQFPSRPRITDNGDGTITLTPPDSTRTIYTLDGADPRLRGGAIAPDAIDVIGSVTLPADSNFRARTYDESRIGVFPSSPWSGAVPGEVGAPYMSHPRLTNVSTRAALAAGNDAVIAGLVIEESDGKPVLIRGVGPALRRYNINGVIAAPRLEIFNQAGQVIASNQGWGSDAAADLLPGLAAELGAFPFDEGSADAATLAMLPAGNYTVHLTSADGDGGTGLLEVYEQNDIGSVLNLSVRGSVRGEDDPLVAGFVVQGNERKRLLIRAIGPTLASFQVPGSIDNPRLILRREGVEVAVNDDWSDAPNRENLIAASSYVGAFSLADGTADAAMLITVDPGVYTASVEGVDGATGATLVEVYEIR